MKITFENVTKQYGNVVAVNDLSLEIESRTFATVLGPSGCGKTTLLRLIAGLERPSSGRIYFDGTDVTDQSPRERNIAMVFQNFSLYPHLRSYDNLALTLRARKWPKEKINDRIDETARLLKMEHLLSKRVDKLSGGEQQRIAIGRAIVREPHIFLLDEPLSNLDAKLRIELRVELLQLHKRIGTTTIHVTHDQVEALSLGERIIMLNQGRLQQYGTAAELYDGPSNKFVASFVGFPEMNFFEAVIKRSGESLLLRLKTTEVVLPLGYPDSKLASLDGKEVYLGVRADRLTLGDHIDGKTIGGKVEFVQMTGFDSYAAVLTQEGRVYVRVRDRAFVNVGQSVAVCFPLSGIHLFDKGGEQRSVVHIA